MRTCPSICMSLGASAAAADVLIITGGHIFVMIMASINCVMCGGLFKIVILLHVTDAFSCSVLPYHIAWRD